MEEKIYIWRELIIKYTKCHLRSRRVNFKLIPKGTSTPNIKINLKTDLNLINYWNISFGWKAEKVKKKVCASIYKNINDEL